VQKNELASVESTTRHYVRRGLSYPCLLCERQDRCNSAFDDWNGSRSTPN